MITVSTVRLVDQDGNQVGIVPTNQAMEMASQVGLDLVEVAPNSKPPVCRIMNYGKYKYEIAKKQKLARKNRHVSHVKEIKMRSEISEHDYSFKLKHAIEFLKRGDKVKFTLVFRGREILHRDIGESVLKRIEEDLAEIANVEMRRKREGNNLAMIVVSK